MAYKQRVKRFMIPLLIGLTLFIGFLGTNSINSDKYYQNHGVTLTSINVPTSVVRASADAIDNTISKSIVADIMNAADNISDKIISTVAHKGQQFPSGIYGMRDAFKRVYANSDDSQIDWIAKYIYSLRSSNSIHSYTNGDILSQIMSSFGMLIRGLGGLILMILLGISSIVSKIGSIILTIIGSLNIFRYIGDAINNVASTTGDKGIRDAIQTFVDLWASFKPIIMVVATLLLMFVIGRVIMSSSGSRGRIFGTGIMKYFSVFFAWSVLPFVLGGIISYSTNITSSLNIRDDVSNQIQSTFYNAKAPFASAFYSLPVNNSQITSEDKGGIDAQTVYASWSNGKELNLNGSSWSTLNQWMTGDSFDADDVNAMLGWTPDDSDTRTNSGYFSHNTKGDSTDAVSDKGKSWAASHRFLSQAMDDSQSGVVVSDENLEKAGFNKDLFDQTASGTTNKNKYQGPADRLRKLAMTHVIAVWGIGANGKMSVSKDTGMNTAPRVSWSSVNLVGDTPIAKIANYSEIIVQMFFTVMYAMVAYAGMIVILTRTIGQALIDQLRASTGSIGSIARAILSAMLTMLILMYVVISVDMIGPMIGAVNQLIKAAVATVLGGGGIGSLAGQIVSLVGLWFGGAIVVRMFMSIRGGLMDGATSMVNQVAEAIDRAMGIQPGTDSSASAGMKRGAMDARRTMVRGFSAMDKTKKTLQSSQRMATSGLRNIATAGAEGLGKAGPAAELAATAYAGPVAGKAAGMATKAGASALKGVAKGADAADKAIGVDETMDDAGAVNTAGAVKNNAKDAYSKARAAGMSRTEALQSAGKQAVETAAGNEKDVDDPNLGNEDRENDFNKVVGANRALQSAKDDRKSSQNARQLQRKIADKTSMLTTQSQEYTEALQDLGAAKMADKVDGKISNGAALQMASKQLQAAKKSQVDAGVDHTSQETLVNKAQDEVNKSKEQLKSVKSSVQKQVADGSMTKPAAQAAISQARSDLNDKREVLRSEKSKMDTLVKTERTAEQSIHQAQGAVNMMQEAVLTQGKDATFTKPSGLATVQQSAQQVRDTHKSMVKTQRNVDTLVQAADSRMNGSTTTSQTGRLNASRSGSIPTASGSSTTSSATQTVNDKQTTNVGVQHNVSEGVTQSHSIAGTSTSGLQSGQHTSPVKSTPGLASGTSTTQSVRQDVNDRQTTNVNTQHHVNNVENHTSGQTVTNTSRGTSGSVSSNTSTPITSTPTGTSRSRNVQQHVTDQNTTNVDVTRESVNNTISHAKNIVTNLEKTVQDGQSSYNNTSSIARQRAEQVQKLAQKRRYSTKLTDLTDDTN